MSEWTPTSKTSWRLVDGRYDARVVDRRREDEQTVFVVIYRATELVEQHRCSTVEQAKALASARVAELQAGP